VSARRARFADGRWQFQHGPIDCIVHAEGDASAVDAAVERAWQRFTGVLAELMAELPLLRQDLSLPLPLAGEGGGESLAMAPRGPIARRMLAAAGAQADNGRFITAMAAVAGSVAEDLIAHFDVPGIRRAYVNNGGDIAVHLAAGESFGIGLVADPARGLAGLPLDGRFVVDAASPVRGIATSGWRGRSLSLGIADAATVLAATASMADAAATTVANAVDLDDPRIVRRAANQVRDGSDLGERLVTVGVPPLSMAQADAALARGRASAEREIAAGRIVAALLCLQGRFVACGAHLLLPSAAAETALA